MEVKCKQTGDNPEMPKAVRITRDGRGALRGTWRVGTTTWADNRNDCAVGSWLATGRLAWYMDHVEQCEECNRYKVRYLYRTVGKTRLWKEEWRTRTVKARNMIFKLIKK